MIAQVLNRGKYGYVVQVLLEDKNGIFRWETVDSSLSQGKARELYDHLRKEEYCSVSDIYKSEYYQKNWIL